MSSGSKPHKADGAAGSSRDLVFLCHGQDGVVVDHDPAARPRRRTFTAAYKAEILDRWKALPKGSPERGALLRREGLYSSHLAEWRSQRAAGVHVGLGPRSSAGHRVHLA